VPQSGDIGIGVSILSYNGQVQFGLVTDRKFVPEPQAIVDRFAPEFEKLVLWLLLEGDVPAGTHTDDNATGADPRVAHDAEPDAVPDAEPDEEPSPAPVVPPKMIKKKGLLARARG
jgi:hypothetical protein